MHRSRLAGFIIDCKDTAPAEAARFWGEALGMKPHAAEGRYAELDASARDVRVEVQRVEHESRLHLDIESDDVDAEAARLEALGARKLEKVRTWWVMEAPTGQRFCVVRAKCDLSTAPGATLWG
jgi:hypothetical protein